MNQQQLLKLEAASLDPEFLKREPFARLLATIRKTQLPLKIQNGDRLYRQPSTRSSRLPISKFAIQRAALVGSDPLNTPDERGVRR
jgi:hypothetical protein